MRTDSARPFNKFSKMANSTSISVSESSVYRGLYSGLSTTSHQSTTEQLAPDEYGRLVDMNKWTFIQKLLAIEEAHDRRRMERDRRNKERDYLLQKQQSSDNTSDVVAPDLLSRWLYHQVLEDSTDELPSAGPCSTDPCSTDPCSTDQTHLPALSKGQTPASQIWNKHAGPATSSQTHGVSENSASSSPQTAVDQDNDMACVIHRETPNSRMSNHTPDQEDTLYSIKTKRKRQLRLPPILLPRVYAVEPRPLKCRQFLTPTSIRGPITDEEWEDLKDCRYIRHAVPRFAFDVAPSNVSSLHYNTILM